MGGKILFITTDQQRYDSPGCSGGSIARTRVADSLAAGGISISLRYYEDFGAHASPSGRQLILSLALAFG
jgi:arylsulfatase A-like enzyme